MDASRSAVVMVDYQTRLVRAIDGGDAVVAAGARLGQIAHLAGVPVVATEQNPDGLGHNVPQIAQWCDDTFAKMTFDALGAGLVKHLRRPNNDGVALQDVLIAGCETHVCLLQTAMRLMEEAFGVWVVEDACGSRSTRNHGVALERLRAEGAQVVTTEMVAFEFMRSAEHPKFKEIQALIK